jgi:hypothetical protein
MATLIRLPNRELKLRVARGASLLDACRPGWAEKVDLRKLGGIENDVIEQVFGDHEEAGRVFGVPDIRESLQAAYEGRRLEPDFSWAAHGFQAARNDYGGDWRAAYRELRRLWRTEVKKRRARFSVAR